MTIASFVVAQPPLAAVSALAHAVVKAVFARVSQVGSTATPMATAATSHFIRAAAFLPTSLRLAAAHFWAAVGFTAACVDPLAIPVANATSVTRAPSRSRYVMCLSPLFGVMRLEASGRSGRRPLRRCLARYRGAGAALSACDSGC